MLLMNMRKLTTISVSLLSLFTLFSVCIAGDTLIPNQPLADGETLVSAGGTFALGFFSPNNSNNRYVGIWYDNIPVHTVVWVANRENPVTDTTGSLMIAANGSLIITNHNSTTFWFSTATSLSNPVAQILDNGNLVVTEEKSSDPARFAWQSFDYPTDTMLPGMKVGLNLITGLNRNLTSWKGDDDPSPGDYCHAMDIRGDPQIILWEGSVRKWWSGPWNGIDFTGPPVLNNSSMVITSFVNNKEEIYNKFEMINKSVLLRKVMHHSGTMQGLVWQERTNMWNLFRRVPEDQCDGSSLCGAYGVCNPNSLSICSCLEGFEPKSQQEWYTNTWSGGCVRKILLDCRNGTDGFRKVSGAILPDSLNASVSMGMSLGECRGVCLSNCSCTAYASADIRGSGSGCIIWVSELIGLQLYKDGGQDLYLRLAAADLGSAQTKPLKSRHVIVAIILSIVLGTLLLSCVGFWIWRKNKSKRDASSIYEGDDLDLPLFDLGTISIATNNFSVENKLGEGGFGPVYKGKLGEEQEIAVKRLAKTSIQGLDELKTEVQLIAKLQHVNLVRLLGCCIQGEERILIYEYMPNKSLDDFLFDKEKGVQLDWKIRYQIITGIARGLLYLHQDSRFKIIHRDLKASNILLDKDMNPKISDFGMARIFGGDEAESRTRRVVGTYGYMSPEYVMEGIFSMKSDIYSFGVLVLEIISGQKNKGVYLSDPHLYLLGHAWSLWNEGKCLELVDESMGHSFTTTEVMRCIKVGLLCVQECPNDRPTMSSAVFMLGNDTVSFHEPKQPGFGGRQGPSEVNSSSKKKELYSINSITITMPIGR